MSSKPLIVGESNPYGGHADFALYPSPDGCSGHRLCCLILRMRRKVYIDSFDRVNLVVGKWAMKSARSAAAHLRTEHGRIILLGSKVCAAFDIPFKPFSGHEEDGVRFAILPHPSGLCRLWRDPDAGAKARNTVLNLAPELEVGVT